MKSLIEHIKPALLLFLLLGIGFSSLVWGQSFTASVSENNVALGGRFQYAIEIENIDKGNLEMPDFGTFKVVGGPSQSRQSMNINGKQSFSMTYTYVLQATKEGKHTISAARLTGGKRPYATENISINVYKEKAAGAKSSTKEVFARLSISKSQLYPGEELIATHKLYSKLELESIDLREDVHYDGFMATALKFNPNQVSTEVLNGVRYYVLTIDKSVLTPVKRGLLTLPGLKIDVVTRQAKQVKTNHPFFPYQTRYEKTTHNITGNSASIQVKDFPGNKPLSFSGAVGNFTVSSSLTNTTTTANNAVNYKITVKGNGNIQLIDVPKPNFPKSFEVYDPEVSESKTSKTWDFLIIPRNAGSYEIEPFEFSFFDMRSKTYKTLKTDAQIIEVLVDQNDQTTSLIGSASNASDQSQSGLTLQTSSSNFKQDLSVFFGSWRHLFLAFIPFILLGLFLIFMQKNKALKADVVGYAKRKAHRAAQSKMKLAYKAMQEDKQAVFYEETLQALYGFIQDKLNITQSDTTKEHLKVKLFKNNISEELIDQFMQTVEDCEMAQYAPSSSVSMQQTYQNSIDLIKALNHKI